MAKSINHAKAGVATPSFIVGLGASAGGLQALQALLSHLERESDMAFVVVTHRDPSHASMLTALLQSVTPLPVTDAVDGQPVQPGRIYVAPAEQDLTFNHGHFRFVAHAESTGRSQPIDVCFRSLAAERRRTAVGVVLSGTGTDGTLGLRAIRGEGGLTIAQTPESAAFGGMPQSAIAAGLADYHRPPAEIPRVLARYALRLPVQGQADDPAWAPVLQRLFVQLRQRTGVDFSAYKSSTVCRRIERRVSIHQLEDAASYGRFVEQHAHELDLLFADLLIGVTSFFRDPDVHAALLEHFLPPLLASATDDMPLRMWVPGCSTGEEAYAIAMLVRESMDALRQPRPVHIFATDLDARALEIARAGQYPEGIRADVSPDRLARFFEVSDGGYRVVKDLRQMLVFAAHNLLNDPPFTRLDLISCRNVLIYLNTPIQQELLQVFHYALQPRGLLLLGSSESVGDQTRLFRPATRAARIFLRQLAPLTIPNRLQLPILLAGRRDEPAGVMAFSRPQAGLAHPVEQLLIERFAPAALVVNERGDIHYIHGRTGPFLEPAPGTPSLNAIKMARSGLGTELAAALRKAVRQRTPVVRSGLRVRADRTWMAITLTVSQILDPEPIRGLLLVTFEPAARAPAPVRAEGTRRSRAGGSRLTRDERLARELAETREMLVATIQQLATANEELQSTNEELQSINEELQSSNEELETSREEMQSLNEELQTVNAELQAKLAELSQAGDDMKNLLNSTQIATVFLSGDLRVERFTPAARRVISLIDSDIGRPIADLAMAFEEDCLEQEAQAVLASGQPREREIRTRTGVSFVMRLVPYRTSQDVVRGVVVTFADVSAMKEAAEAMRQEQRARAYAEGVLLTVREPVVVLADDLRILLANPAFYEVFDTAREETEGRLIYQLGSGQWNIARLRHLLERILPEKSEMREFKVDRVFPGLGRRRMSLNARRLGPPLNDSAYILLAFEDRTLRRRRRRAAPPP